jgi:hypothetical protein
MSSLLIAYLQLCRFKNNPLDLMPSKAFLWKNIAFYILAGTIVEANISEPVEAFIEVNIETLVTCLLILTLLLITKRLAIYSQLLTAALVCENFLIILGIITEILDVVAQKTPYEDYPLYLGILLVIWFIAIVSYILKQVFSFNLATCISLAVFYFSFTFIGTFLIMEVL